MARKTKCKFTVGITHAVSAGKTKIIMKRKKTYKNLLHLHCSWTGNIYWIGNSKVSRLRLWLRSVCPSGKYSPQLMCLARIGSVSVFPMQFIVYTITSLKTLGGDTSAKHCYSFGKVNLADLELHRWHPTQTKTHTYTQAVAVNRPIQDTNSKRITTLYANKANRLACDLSVYVKWHTNWRIFCFFFLTIS